MRRGAGGVGPRGSKQRPTGLGPGSDFFGLWAGQTVSMLGSQVGLVALPLTAAIHLDATPSQMGILTAAGTAPFLVLSLFAGVWVDRKKQKPVLLAANLGRAALLGLVPLMYFTGLLSVAYLCAIAFLAGACGVFFDLAYQSFLPKLVDRDRLVDANSRVKASGSVANLAGPGIGGFLVQALTAPVAVLADTLSFLVSAAWLLRVRVQERMPAAPAEGRNLKHEMGEGLKVTFGDRVLRAGACAAATYNLFWGAIQAVLILHMVRRLDMSAGEIGLIFAVGSTGALLGALATAPAARRFGVGPTIVGSAALSCAALLLIPPADGPVAGSVLLAAALFVNGLGLTGWNVQIETLQQATVPAAVLGRMNSSYLLLSLGAGSLGAVFGGFLGAGLGLRAALWVGATGAALSWLWLFFSPLRTLHQSPRPSGARLGPGSSRVAGAYPGSEARGAQREV